MPKWLDLARKEIGTKEWPGSRTNPSVATYYKDAVGSRMADSVPWCAAFVGSMLARAGQKPSGSLMARSYLVWGQKLAGIVQGAVVVFARGRPPSGHVTFVESWTASTLTCVGGNQGDAVTRKVYPRRGALGFRWPKGVPIPKRLTFSQQETAMADMTLEQIMQAAQKLHGDANSIMSIGAARKAAQTAASLVFYLAKAQLADRGGSPKALKMSLKKPKPAKKPAKRKVKKKLTADEEE